MTVTAMSARKPLYSAAILLIAIASNLLGTIQVQAEDDQSEDNPFIVDIDYTDTVSFGGRRLFKLIKNSGPDIGYRCKVGPTSSANIAKIEHDDKCERIIVTASGGPFLDDSGKILEKGYLNFRVAENGTREAVDLIPLVVEDKSGKEIFKTSFSLRASNTSTKFLLRGLQRPRNSEPGGFSDQNFVVERGKTYVFEILTPDGMPLSPNFDCSRSDSFSDHNDVNISVASGCTLTLKNAQPGGLHVDIQTRGSPAYKDTLMFELVDADWAPPVLEGLTFQLTPEQKQEEYQTYLARIVKSIELRKMDKAKGEGYAQDDWYLDYLEQIRRELQIRLGGSGKE